MFSLVEFLIWLVCIVPQTVRFSTLFFSFEAKVFRFCSSRLQALALYASANTFRRLEDENKLKKSEFVQSSKCSDINYRESADHRKIHKTKRASFCISELYNNLNSYVKYLWLQLMKILVGLIIVFFINIYPLTASNNFTFSRIHFLSTVILN